MNGFFRLSIIGLILICFIHPALSQSLAYKTLLNNTYEKDFALVYPERKELFRGAVILDTCSSRL